MVAVVRNFKLDDDEWEVLKDICWANNCLGNRGPATGKPSVNAMLRKLVKGELVLSRPVEVVVETVPASSKDVTIDYSPPPTFETTYSEPVKEDQGELDYDEEFDWGA